MSHPKLQLRALVDGEVVLRQSHVESLPDAVGGCQYPLGAYDHPAAEWLLSSNGENELSNEINIQQVL